MNRGWAALAVVLAAGGALAAPLAGPAGADHEEELLLVTVALNAAGADRVSITDDAYDSTDYGTLVADVAIALDRPPGSFRPVENLRGAHAELDGKLAEPDGRNGLSYALDTGRLQLLAQGHGYDAVLVKVCTPRVGQVVDTLVAPESVPFDTPGSRCRGWYQPVDDPPIRAVVQLLPDRQRYPEAVGRVAGAAAVAFGLLGIGATLLRRGPLRRRSAASWLCSSAAALVVLPLGSAAASLSLWWAGAPADPMLLGGGSEAEQVARTLLPGLAFALPALLPAAVLLTVPRRERTPPAPAGPRLPPGPPWWPTAWWPQWVAEGAPPGRPPPGQEP